MSQVIQKQDLHAGLLGFRTRGSLVVPLLPLSAKDMPFRLLIT